MLSISVPIWRPELDGFGHFLKILKAVFPLFLTPDNVQLTAAALTEAKHHLLDAKGTLYITVLEAILTGRQTRLEIQCLYGDPMSHNFHKTSFLKNS